jgi:hypothetical protein
VHSRGTQPRKVPGLDHVMPKDVCDTATELRASPEFSLRFLAQEFREAQNKRGTNLALVLPHVAYPAWNKASDEHGAYGNRTQYVSRSYAIYRAFTAVQRGPSR